jgi:hypothetical protein
LLQLGSSLADPQVETRGFPDPDECYRWLADEPVNRVMTRIQLLLDKDLHRTGSGTRLLAKRSVSDRCRRSLAHPGSALRNSREPPMQTPEDGDDGRDGGEPREPGKGPLPATHDVARALSISATLVVLCFVVHILVLVLVDPLRVLPVSKLNAFALSSIPLAMGLVFAFDAITSFMRLEARSAGHFVAFLLVVLFGSFSVHGLLGFILYVARHAPAF